MCHYSCSFIKYVNLSACLGLEAEAEYSVLVSASTELSYPTEPMEWTAVVMVHDRPIVHLEVVDNASSVIHVSISNTTQRDDK